MMTTQLTRRHLLTGLLAAPAVIACERLMRIDAALARDAFADWRRSRSSAMAATPTWSV
jgi:hypothetical protein